MVMTLLLWGEVLPDTTQGHCSAVPSAHICTGGRLPISAEQEAAAPAGFVAFLRQCWHQTPKERPNFKAISAWLKSMDADAGPSDARPGNLSESKAAAGGT